MAQISNYLNGSLGHDESVLDKELYTSNDMTVFRNGIFWKTNRVFWGFF